MSPVLHVLPDPAALAEAATRALIERVGAGLAKRPTFRWALTGGRTPKAHYQQLAQPEVAARIDWSRLEVFWGDERCVPPDDPESNFRMAHEAFLAQVPVRHEAVHRIEGELPPEQAAERYAAALGRGKLDLVQLGMGDDGHICSLFPGGPWLLETERRVVPSRASYAPFDRVTLTLPAINAAREVHFMVTGEAKAGRVVEVLRQQRYERFSLPASHVQPTSGVVHWFLDRAAASRLLVEDLL